MELKYIQGYKECKHIVDKFMYDFRINETNVFAYINDCENIVELFPHDLSWTSRDRIEGIDYWYIISCFYTFTLAIHAHGEFKGRAKELFLALTDKDCTYCSSYEAKQKMYKKFKKYRDVFKD